jgi:hypothetical protein
MDGEGKIRRELRHPDDVFAPESMETLKYAPVTIEHPPEMLDPSNVAQYSVGHTTERVEKKEDKLDTDLIIEQAKGIDAIEKEGIRELSCGYAADIIDEQGDYRGAPYDFRQVNIKYNHLAMVKRGRAGPEIRMRLDSADAVMQNISKPKRAEFSQESGVSDEIRLGEDEVENAIGEPIMKKLVISGQEVELPSDVADSIQDMFDRFDEMRAKLAQLEEAMKDKKDVDISQKGVSPQVKVEQQGPDGRGAPGKIPAKPGTITGGPVGKADDEEEHGVVGGVKAKAREPGAAMLSDDDDEEEKHGDDDDDKKDDEEEMDDGEEAKVMAHGAQPENDFEGAAGKGLAGGSAMGPVDRLKQDIEEVKKAYGHDQALMKKMDKMEGKLDAMAAESFGKEEKHGDRKDSVSAQVRKRVKLERTAEKIVPEMARRFDSLSDVGIRKAVIKHFSPNADLQGKSADYIEARFDSLCEKMEDEGVSEYRREMGRGMLGISGDERMDAQQEVDPTAARIKMIKQDREAYKSDLSAKKRHN